MWKLCATHTKIVQVVHRKVQTLWIVCYLSKSLTKVHVTTWWCRCLLLLPSYLTCAHSQQDSEKAIHHLGGGAYWIIAATLKWQLLHACTKAKNGRLENFLLNTAGCEREIMTVCPLDSVKKKTHRALRFRKQAGSPQITFTAAVEVSTLLKHTISSSAAQEPRGASLREKTDWRYHF